MNPFDAVAPQADFAVTQSAPLTAHVSPATDMAGIKKAAQNFESVFISQMFKGIGGDSLFGGGHGEEMFRSLLVDEYSKQVVKRGGLGLTDTVMRALISQQEKAS
jgi:Rod binding domain-containing protein